MNLVGDCWSLDSHLTSCLEPLKVNLSPLLALQLPWCMLTLSAASSAHLWYGSSLLSHLDVVFLYCLKVNVPLIAIVCSLVILVAVLKLRSQSAAGIYFTISNQFL